MFLEKISEKTRFLFDFCNLSGILYYVYFDKYNLLSERALRMSSVGVHSRAFFLGSSTRPVDIKSSPVGGKPTNESWYTISTQALTTRCILTWDAIY